VSRFGNWRRARGAAATVAALALAITAVAALVASPVRAAAAAAGRPRSATPGFVLSDGRYRAFEASSPRDEIFPSGINDEGYVTGEYIRPDRESGFVRDGRGRISTFDVPGARGTEAAKLNDRGQVVGRYSEDTPFVDDSARVRGFIRHRGTTTRIDAPKAVHTLPTAINDRGDVVGYYVDSGGTTHGFVWRHDRFTTVDVPGATSPTPVDINDRGDVVGVYLDAAGAPKGFLLSQGRYRTITAPGAPTTIPFGINDAGQIVGYTADDLKQSGARGFLLSDGPDGPFTPITFPGAPKTVALGINDGGEIVGLHENPDLTPSPPASDGGSRSGGTGGQPPGMLSDLDLRTVRDITVSAAIAEQVEGLLAAADADGLSLTGHGHRDHARQIALRRAHCGTSYYAIYQMPARRCSPPTARPGTSMHERGEAIDFSCDGMLIRSHSNPCYRWLADHAADYGLYNLPSEAWHWSTNGS
jgi:probable HAF family extracellular repeat protein